jgi:hypothetical protein
MQPQNGSGPPPEITEGNASECNGDTAVNGLSVSSSEDLKLEQVEEDSAHEPKGAEEKTHNDGIQSIKERIISTSRLLKILEKQRSGRMQSFMTTGLSQFLTKILLPSHR